MIFKFVCLYMLNVDFLFHKNKLRDKANLAAKRSLITIVSLTIPFFKFYRQRLTFEHYRLGFINCD